ncbi:MAG: HPF/RaiA family ribosome-associated protein [Oxalobacteraceae bacterium]|nr:HPF/RaiA family ribosome-associated protein [Oxalobacteraceae bacterium]
MNIPLKITYRDLRPSPAIEAALRAQTRRFEPLRQYILRCNATVEVLGRHWRGGHHYNVRVAIAVPGGEVAVSRNHDDADIVVAIGAAFDAARMRLEDHVQRLRRKVKTHEAPLHGRISKLFAGDAGFGFIETADGREFYFRRDNVMEPRAAPLAIGAEVQFLEALGTESLQARRIVAGHHRI